MELIESSCIQRIEYRFDQRLLFVRFQGKDAPTYVWHAEPWMWGLYWAMVARKGSLGKAWHSTIKRWVGSHIAKLETEAKPEALRTRRGDAQLMRTLSEIAA